MEYEEFISKIFQKNLDAIPHDANSINAYFVNNMDANGVAFYSINSFIVKDVATVNSYRTIAHEIGHLLGLQHVFDNKSKLMYRVINGEILATSEILSVRSRFA